MSILDSCERILNKVKSLHFSHSYATLDRIDTSAMADVPEHLCLPYQQNWQISLLPSIEEDEMMKQTGADAGFNLSSF